MSDFLYLGASSSHIFIKTYDVMWFTKLNYLHPGSMVDLTDLWMNWVSNVGLCRLEMSVIFFLKMNKYQDHVDT